MVIKPQIVLIYDTTVKPSISVQGNPEITIEKAGKNLKSIPAKLKSQHRGQLFLPFFDDDPKTAEIMPKVLLLAENQEIQYPTILEHILAK